MSTKLKLGELWDHNGTYMEGFGFQYRDHGVIMELDSQDELTGVTFSHFLHCFFLCFLVLACHSFNVITGSFVFLRAGHSHVIKCRAKFRAIQAKSTESVAVQKC